MNPEEDEIPYPFIKHSDTSKEVGGLIINDKDANNTKLVFEILKELSKKLLKFELMDMLKFSRPAKITSPITVLTCCGNEYVATELLDKANDATNPIERMKYVSAFIMSGIHSGPEICRSKAPFNPILGETFQAVNSSGARLFLEQTMHHPPSFNFDIIGPNKNYELMGFGTMNAHMNGMNSIKGWREGKNILKFKDGTFMNITNPITRINGVMYGDRTYNYSGTIVVKDFNHKIECSILLKEEVSESIIQAMFSKRKPMQYDEFKIEIKQLNIKTKEKELKAKGCGSWLGQIVFDNKVYWSILDKKDQWRQDNLFLLPSDSLYRTDLNAVLKNDFETAQIEKERLEILQRNDKKKRAEYKEKNNLAK